MSKLTLVCSSLLTSALAVGCAGPGSLQPLDLAVGAKRAEVKRSLSNNGLCRYETYSGGGKDVFTKCNVKRLGDTPMIAVGDPDVTVIFKGEQLDFAHRTESYNNISTAMARYDELIEMLDKRFDSTADAKAARAIPAFVGTVRWKAWRDGKAVRSVFLVERGGNTRVKVIEEFRVRPES